MKVSCLQENLARGLNTVSRAVSTRSTLPVLSNVLLATDGGRLKISATNLEIFVTCWIGAKVEEEGSTTIPHRTLNDLVAALPPERVELTLDKKTETTHLTCARTEAHIKGIDAQEYPLMPQADEENRVKIDKAILKGMINQVAFAAATDDARPTLTGVLTRLADDKMTMAATDGYRLAMKTADLGGGPEPGLEFVIPARALMELARIADDDSESVYIATPPGRNQVIFDMGNIVLVSQLIDGNYPDFQPIIPRRYLTRTVLNTSEFAKACKMAEIFARESSYTARVRVEPGNELMKGFAQISATSSETGDNVAQIDASVEGEDIDIAFNVRFMNQVLGVMDTAQVALETTRAAEPGVIKPVGKDDYLHIIMPMHVSR